MKEGAVRNTGFALLAEISEELSKGGEWLAAARTWMRSNIPRGDSITWGSTEPVKVAPRQLEELAFKVALYALLAERTRVRKIQDEEGQTPLPEMRAEIERGKELARRYIAATRETPQKEDVVVTEEVLSLVESGGNWVVFGFNTAMSHHRQFNTKV